MTAFDLAVLGFLIVSGLIAFMRGFVRSVLSIVAWIAAAAAAVTYEPQAHSYIAAWVPSEDWTTPASYTAIFIASLIVFLLFARIVGGAVKASVIGGLDRTFGLLFGLARGALLIACLYVAGDKVVPVDHWPDAVLTSRTLPYIFNGVVSLSRYIPAKYQDIIPVHAPPARQTTPNGIPPNGIPPNGISPNGISNATPDGRAIDSPARK